MALAMKAFSVKTSIRATPERIWAMVTDAAGYVRWNNTIHKVEGKIALGEQVTVRLKLNPGRAFPISVAEFQVPRRMVWTGGLPLGLFKGERTFTLTPEVSGEVEFSMCEKYTGLMAPLICRTIPDLKPAFDQFAEGLKRAAEAI